VGDGLLLEIGSHDELVAKGGHYADMYATWISQSHGDHPGSAVGVDPIQ
jgi:ATP-binding cassette, subfamily B, bacterial